VKKPGGVSKDQEFCRKQVPSGGKRARGGSRRSKQTKAKRSGQGLHVG